MLNNISWAEYTTVIGGALILYYLYVFLRYGNRRRPSEREAQPSPVDFVQDVPEAFPAEEQQYDQITDLQYQEANNLMERLVSTIHEAVAAGTDKETMKILLSNLLDEYPALNIPMFRHSVIERIVAELNELDFVSLTEREVEGLW